MTYSSRLLTFASLSLLIAACGSDPPGNGTEDAGADSGSDTTVDVQVDAEDDIADDVPGLDVADIALDTDEDAEVRGALGEECDINDDCASDICLRIDAEIETGFCSVRCDETCDDDAYSCIFVTATGVDGQSVCVPLDYCADGDGDGYGIGPGCAGPDCDDALATTNPAADELCDGVDNDCDGTLDDNPVGTGADCDTGFPGACGVGRMQCVAGGQVECVGSVMATDELCDGVDNDCDGETDEDDTGAPIQRTCYDGPAGTLDEGECAAGTQMCAAGDFGSCVGQVMPSNEICDGEDNDCDGDEDEVDGDMDGFASCPGANRDCDDENPNIFPGATELCNAIDDNCNGLTDEFATQTFYRDNDGDGFGTTTVTADGCVAPAGYVTTPGDCADNNANVNPDAPELCNNRDDNCNEDVDEGLDEVNVYRDFDGDGYGTSSGLAEQSCLIDEDGDGTFESALLDGYVPDNTDCNDATATSYPDAPEICDGILNNCNDAVADWLCPTQCAGSWPVPIGGTAGYPAITQLDGDAELEVITRIDGVIRATNHDGTELWTTAAAGVHYSYPTLADMDGNGYADIVSSETGGFVRVYNGNDGSLQSEVVLAQARGYHGASVFDVDGDGGLDVIPSVSGDGAIVYYNANGTYRDTTLLPAYDTAGGEHFYLETPTIYDMDGNGSAEVLLGTGAWSCSGNATRCIGRQYVFNTDGTWWNDPSYTDAGTPWFQVSPIPRSYAGESRFGVIADIDADGTEEFMHVFSGSGGRYIWNFDGTEHPLSGDSDYRSTQPMLVPLTDTWELDLTGALRHVGGPVVDMNGDGEYESIVNTGPGIAIARHDGVLVPSTLDFNGVPTIGDINRDGALDVLFVGADNNSLNCYTYGAGTYNTGAILSYGGETGTLNRSMYPTQSLDPFEPNQPGVAFNPATSTDPLADSRAFWMRGFRDRTVSGAGWQHELRAMLGSQGDVDYYAYTGGYMSVTLTDLVRDYDMRVHIYNRDTLAFIETRTSTSAGTSDESLRCRNTNGCLGGPFLFILEVAPSDPTVDYGPFPYTINLSL